MHIDTFSGPVADLPKNRRTDAGVLAVLAKHPRVSTWDMEVSWLRICIYSLMRAGLVEEDKTEPYPYHRYTVTAAGERKLMS